MKFNDTRRGENESLDTLAHRIAQFPSDSIHSLLVRELMDSIEESVILVDSELRVVAANRRATALFGYSSSEFTTKTLAGLMEAGERRTMLGIVRNASERRGSEASFLTRARRKVRLRFSLSPLMLEGEKAQGFLLVGREPDEDIEPEFADASNGLTERMLGSFPEPLFVIDGPTRIVRDCNIAASAVFGFSREEFVGRRLLDHFADAAERERNEALMARADGTYATAGIFRERVFFPRKNLSSLLCDCIGLPFLDRNGSLDTIMVMLFDRSLEEDCEAELMGFIERVGAFAEELGAVAKSHAKPDRARNLSELGFTPRQIEISRFVVQGASSKDIGFRLGIVESTVKHHLSIIFRKLGVATRIEFMRKLSERRFRIA